MTSTYKIYRHPVSGLEAVKVGASGGALFGVFWMLASRLWSIAAVWFGLLVGLLMFCAVQPNPDAVAPLWWGGQIALWLIPVFKGNAWREAALIKEGYEKIAELQADNGAAAIAASAKTGYAGT